MTRAHEGTEQHLLNEIPETVSVDVLGGTARRDSEHKTKTTSDRRYKLSTSEVVLVVLFATFGYGSSFNPRTYLSGFYLDFLKQANLNVVLGTVSISTLLITQGLSPYILPLLPGFKKLSLTTRCLLLLIGNIICYFVMSLVDVMVEADPGGGLVFGVVGAARALQGLCCGSLTVIVQGEIVDLYLADKKSLMVVICSAIHFSALVPFVVGTELYTSGKWLLTGLLIPTFDLIPLFLLPFISKLQRKTSAGGYCVGLADEDCDPADKETAPPSRDKKEATWLQRIVFYIPDLTVFIANVTFILLIFSLPLRLKEYTGKSLNTAVLFTTLIPTFGFISSLIVSYFTLRKLPALLVILAGTVVFFAGAIIAFGATTEFLVFPGSYELGSVLVGLGDAPVINLIVLSKFELYEKWGLNTRGLGARSSAVFNFSMCFSQVVGTVMSGLTVSRGSEVPTLVGAGTAGLFNIVALLLCLLVK